MIRRGSLLALGLAMFLGLCIHGAMAQSAGWPGANAVQTTLYFGLKSDDGAGVSEQEWATFLREVITPRFPDGLTAIDAYGQGSPPQPGAALAQTTKVLIVVHADTIEASNAVNEIKTEYKRRFSQAGLFHTEAPVRIVE
jgi:hypothetical protein